MREDLYSESAGLFLSLAWLSLFVISVKTTFSRWKQNPRTHHLKWWAFLKTIRMQKWPVLRWGLLIVVLALYCPVTLIGREQSRDLLGHDPGQGQDHIISSALEGLSVDIFQTVRRWQWTIISSKFVIIWSWPWPRAWPNRSRDRSRPIRVTGQVSANTTTSPKFIDPLWIVLIERK